MEAEDDVVEEVEADTVDGSAVIRSIRVVPDESYTIPFISKLTQKKKGKKKKREEMLKRECSIGGSVFRNYRHG